MDLTRAVRVLRSRWPVAVLIALVGAAGGFLGAQYHNDNITPSFRAEAPVSFAQAAAESEGGAGPGPGGTANESQLADAQAIALEVNAAIIEQNPTAQVNVDNDRLVFLAFGRSADEAQTLAQRLRSNYLTRTPPNVTAQLDEEIDKVNQELARVRRQIEDLSLNVSVDEYEGVRTYYQGVIDQLKTLEQALTVELELYPLDTDDPEERSAEQVQEELDLVEARIAVWEEKLNEVPPPPATDFTADQQRLAALERQYRELEDDYQTLFLQREALSGPVVEEVIEVFDETPDPVSRRLFGGVGLAAGLLIGIGAVMIADRVRRPVWVATEMPRIPTLATTRLRRPTSGVWYDNAAGERRRSDIQALRAALAGRLRNRATSVAITGHRLRSSAVKSVAADLAVSMTQAGRSVLLVDADFGSGDTLAEFGEGPLTLAQILQKTGEGFPLQEIPEVRPGMWAIQAGTLDQDPGDLMAGDAFDRVLNQALDHFDAVVVSSGDIRDTVGQELVTRTDGSVVCVKPGRSSSQELASIVDELARRGGNLLGAVLLTRGAAGEPMRALRLSSLGGLIRRKPRPAFTPEASERASEPAMVVDVLHEVAEPVSEPPALEPVSPNGGSAPPASEPTTELLDDELLDGDGRPRYLVASGRALTERLGGDTETIESVIRQLAESEPAKAYAPVSEYLVGLVETIMLYPSRVGIDHDGILPLHPVKNMTTVGSAVGEYLRSELGGRQGAALERLMVGVVFGAGPLRHVEVVRKTLDAWLSVSFFRIHLANTSREPSVWHLASPNRYFQILVDGRRFDGERLRDLTDVILPLFIDDLERQQRVAHRFGSVEAIETLDRAIIDARTFGIELGWLVNGADERARLYYPGANRTEQPVGWNPRWEEGIRANLAPLQRLEFLAAPVLDERELDLYTPV